MPSKKPQFVIRTEKEILSKIAYIASENERSSTQEIVYLIKQHIKDYEDKNGKLLVDEDGNISIAKPKLLNQGKSSTSKTG